MDRARRFRRRADAERYVSAHVLVRRILAWYSGTGPGEVGIGISPEGKPYLASGSGASGSGPCGLSFSISYSGDMVLCGVTRGGRTGVDIQEHSGIDPSVESAAVFMPEAEIDVFLSLPAPDKQRMFFDSWARREAVAKGCGKGLSEDPRLIGIEPAGSSGGRWTSPATSSSAPWNVFDIPVPEGYSAAVAVEEHCVHADLFEFGLNG
jgi:4'-phosphopantetheinyl transferase